MATALDQIKNIGEGLLNAGDAIVDTIGGNIRAAGQQNQNAVDAQTAKIQIEAARAQSDIEQKQENQKLLRTTVYVMLAITAVFVVFKMVLSVIKK